MNIYEKIIKDLDKEDRQFAPPVTDVYRFILFYSGDYEKKTLEEDIKALIKDLKKWVMDEVENNKKFHNEKFNELLRKEKKGVLKNYKDFKK